MPRNTVLRVNRPPFFLPQLPHSTGSPKRKPNTSASSPAIRSLYRTFLRATSASLIHHSTGTRCLRTRYRPVFEQYFHLHQSGGSQNKIREWDERFDNTLRLLQTSATSRGLPHQLTRNLSLLSHSYFLNEAHVSYPKWDPNRAAGKKSPSDNPTTALTAQLDQYMEESLELAEGSAKIILGRNSKKI